MFFPPKDDKVVQELQLGATSAELTYTRRPKAGILGGSHMEKMKKAGKKPRNATRFATAAAACAIAFTLALALVNCDTDTDADYDDLTPGLDRTT
ncbi:MAG: hypothetical protein LBJ35_05000, partial [Spirochaetaceae bacterium]|nr:hypothetical protein [Spirochaetaceae bacterium]